MYEFINDRIKEHRDITAKMFGDGELLNSISDLCGLTVETYKNGKKILLCGNGGSAADAQHIACELVARFKRDRPPLCAMALTVNTSSITAIGNDYEFTKIFSRQVEAFGKKGDLLIGISTSGNSPNVIQAMEKAKEMGMSVAGFTGVNRDAEILKHAQISIRIPSANTPRIQEAHILIGHIVCEYIENELFPK
ncbi:MAG: phosphoheptose isomerase [bacterium]|nr:MAG: phosphoheptose isomerase [bacterium]